MVYVQVGQASPILRVRSVRGDSAALLPDGETVATQGRFVRLPDRTVLGTYRRPVQKPTGLPGGIAVEELGGGPLRPLGSASALRTLPDNNPRDYARSTLRFVGLDGSDRRLVADSLVFSSAQRYQRGRVRMPRADRSARAGVFFVREREFCTLAASGGGSADGCERLERGLWHVQTDGTGLRRVAELPVGGDLADVGVARGGAAVAISLQEPSVSDRPPVGAVLVVDVASGRVTHLPGIVARRVGLMPDARSVVAAGAGLGVLADAVTGETRTVRVPTWSAYNVAALYDVAPDSGLVLSLGLEQLELTPVVGPRAGTPRPVVRYGPWGRRYEMEFTHTDALPDASRVLFVGNHYTTYSCDPG